jgi:hypothetical protein
VLRSVGESPAAARPVWSKATFDTGWSTDLLPDRTRAHRTAVVSVQSCVRSRRSRLTSKMTFMEPKLSTVNAETQTFTGVYWPAPPFFKLVTSLPPVDRMECDLQLANGRVLHEELLEFAAGVDTVGVRRPQPHGIKRIDLAKIRSIRLTRPVEYIADAATAQKICAESV